MRLAKRDGSGWTIEIVDDNTSPRYKTMALDNSGNPGIAYSGNNDGDGTLSTLTYAHWNGASWVIEDITDGSAGDGVFVSLVYDSSGNPFIVDRNGGVRFWYKVDDFSEKGYHWEMVRIDQGTHPDVALDPDTDQPVVSYAYYGQQPLTIARPADAIFSNWVIETVDHVDNGWKTSLKVKSDGTPGTPGTPVVGYQDSDLDALKVAEKVTSP